MKRRLLGALLLSTVALSPLTAAQAAEDGRLGVLAVDYAEEILVGLKGRDLKGKKIGFWPHKAEEIPVPLNLARQWNQAVITEMLQYQSRGMIIVTRERLKTLIDQAARQQLDSDFATPITQIANAAALDYLVVGDIRAVPGGARLSYKVYDVVSGAVLSASNSRKVDYQYRDSNRRDSVTLEGAIKQAANKLAGNTEVPLQVLKPRGIREGTSKVVTPFGDYLGQAVTAELERAVNGAVIGADPLKVLWRPDGGESTQRKPEGSFILEGLYWDLGDAVEVQLNLRDEALGDTVTWRGKVLKGSIPGKLRLIPVGQEFSYVDYGPMGLELSTTEGRDPVYRIGDTMTLQVTTSQPAYLHCYYHQADGTSFRIYPNEYLNSGLERQGKVAGGQLLRLPTHDMPIEFKFTPPSGVERVQCFATNKNVLNELPNPLQSLAVTPLPADTARHLRKVYRAIKGVNLSESQMMVTVKKKRDIGSFK